MIQGHVFIATSLDGQIARADGSIDWLTDTGGSFQGEDYGYGAFIARMDGLVMGSGSFEAVLGFDTWPYDLPVVVMTGRADKIAPTAPEGRDIRFTDEAPAALMARLDSEGWRNVYLDGGAVIRSFLAAGLVAEMIVTRVPVLIGAGRPLFGALDRDIALDHLSTRAYDDGLVQSHYRVRR